MYTVMRKTSYTSSELLQTINVFPPPIIFERFKARIISRMVFGRFKACILPLMAICDLFPFKYKLEAIAFQLNLGIRNDSIVFLNIVSAI